MNKMMTTIIAVALACMLAPEMADALTIEIKSFERSDYISQEDIKEAPGGYKLYVKGVGDVVVRGLRAPKSSGKKCMIDKRSLGELVRVTFSITHWANVAAAELD